MAAFSNDSRVDVVLGFYGHFRMFFLPWKFNIDSTIPDYCCFQKMFDDVFVLPLSTDGVASSCIPTVPKSLIFDNIVPVEQYSSSLTSLALNL